MMNRKLMMSMIAAGTAAVVGLGSVYAAGLSIPQIESESETEETETETETDFQEPEYDDFFDVNSKSESYVISEDCANMSGTTVMAAAEADGYYQEMPMTTWNTEEYSTVDDTGFRDVKLYPLSTFGMDVDTASYSLLRRNTLDDTLEWMPKDAVRIEEMINYFNYDYEMPEGDETFSITSEIANCPWNEDTKLMLVALQAKDIPQEEIKDQNLVFLVDTSGSMYDQDKLPLAVDALKYLMDEMNEKDSVAIVTYAGSSEIALEPTKCTEDGKAEIIRTLDGLTADGGTYGEAGIRTAYELAQESFIEGGNNRVLLLTDGDFNLGQTDDSELVDLVKEKADGQIFLSILGFGTGNYNDALAEELADKGNGNYSYIDSDMEARRVMGAALKGTLNTVAKDSKIQVDFNPEYIKGYRLIGYENRQMDAEDFEDDKKDGGEVGAGQQVTVLYELVMSDSDYEIPTAHSRYTDSETDSADVSDIAAKDSNVARGAGPAQINIVTDEAAVVDSAAGDESDKAGDDSGKVSLAIADDGETEADVQSVPAEGEYLTVSIRYKDPEAETSQLKELAVTAGDEIDEMSDNMSWAAGVAQIGMLLRESEYAGSSDYREVRDRLRELAGGDEFREEFVYLTGRLEGVKLSDDTDTYMAW